MSHIFSYGWGVGRRGNLFADLSRVVIEGSRRLGRILESQYAGSSIDLKSLRHDENLIDMIRYIWSILELNVTFW